MCKKFFAEDVPEINVTSDDIERNVAIISITPTVLESQIIVNQVQLIDESCEDAVAENCAKLELSEMYGPNEQFNKTQISEQDVKKITRNLNNGAKRKTKLRRLGSRQNSKTESDSDEDPPNVVLDAPRRVKRKTSKTKRTLESDKSLDEPQVGASAASIAADDVVYVLKIKPGEKIEQTELKYDLKPKSENSDNIAKFTIENTVDQQPALLSSLDNVTVNSNVFVRTKRKIFTPADDQSGAVIGKDIESSSASDKNEIESLPLPLTINKTTSLSEECQNKIITNLPPLPQSPSMQRRLEQKSNLPKEPSPAIRIMIAKYNQRLSTERQNSSPLSSGSCSPVAWRSPVLERRVRAQTKNYLFQVTKSSSAGNVEKNVQVIGGGDNDNVSVPTTNLVKGVVKSSSAGILNDNWASNSMPEIAFRTFLACDSLKKVNVSSRDVSYTTNQKEEHRHERIFRKQTDHNSNPLSHSSKSGALRKILMKPPIRDESLKKCATNIEQQNVQLPDKATNTVPKIKRKYDAKQSSPKLENASVKASLELDFVGTSEIHDTENTILSERALKLKIAKEEFLRTSSSIRGSSSHSQKSSKNRLSQISAGSESSTDDVMIAKSASAGMIHSASGSYAGNNSDASTGCDSLPRNAPRPSKSQGTVGKFGLSTIASKLRNVKLRKNSKELPKMNTVQKLCRQSLMMDITNVSGSSSSSCRVENVTEKDATLQMSKVKSQSAEKLRKSGSSSTMAFGSLLFRRQERTEKLKKSKSIGQLEANPNDHYDDDDK